MKPGKLRLELGFVFSFSKDVRIWLALQAANALTGVVSINGQNSFINRFRLKFKLPSVDSPNRLGSFPEFNKYFIKIFYVVNQRLKS